MENMIVDLIKGYLLIYVGLLFLHAFLITTFVLISIKFWKMLSLMFASSNKIHETKENKVLFSIMVILLWICSILFILDKTWHIDFIKDNKSYKSIHRYY